MIDVNLLEVGDIVMLDGYILVATHKGASYKGEDVIEYQVFRSSDGSHYLSNFTLLGFSSSYNLVGRVRGG